MLALGTTIFALTLWGVARHSDRYSALCVAILLGGGAWTQIVMSLMSTLMQNPFARVGALATSYIGFYARLRGALR